MLLPRFALATLFTAGTIYGGAIAPVATSLIQPTWAQAPAARQAIQLNLTQSKKVADGQGFKLVPAKAVLPGDTIIYSITATNVSNRAVTKLRIDQKVRAGTVYVAKSATAVSGTQLTFSIDGGKTFSSQPLINKKPAPASAYTNLRWTFADSFAPKAVSKVSYAVQIR
jgi:uncharacterized repeat protein (TIGR01451 family)